MLWFTTVAMLLPLQLKLKPEEERFLALRNKVARIVLEAQSCPASKREFESLLTEHGIDRRSLRDPWGRKYHLDAWTEHNLQFELTITEPGQPGPDLPNPANAARRHGKTRWFDFWSEGPDAKRSVTYDDLEARFACPNLKTSPWSHANSVTGTAPSMGELSGVLVDERGSVQANADIKVDGNEIGMTDSQGRYHLALTPGFYTLAFQKYGFRIETYQGLPVKAGLTTHFNAVMRVGHQD